MPTEKLKDYYTILEIPHTATLDQIKRAYRQQAFICHPDRGGSPARMKAVNEAWTILGDPESRRRYNAERWDQEDQKDRDLARKNIKTSPPRTTPDNSSPPDTLISDIGRILMFIAFRTGKAISAIARFLSRLWKR